MVDIVEATPVWLLVDVKLSVRSAPIELNGCDGMGRERAMGTALRDRRCVSLSCAVLRTTSHLYERGGADEYGSIQLHDG